MNESNDTPTTSADQDAWVELAAAMRAGLLRQAQYLPAMKPDEVKTLVDSAVSLYWLEVQAATFDKEVQLRLARVTASD